MYNTKLTTVAMIYAVTVHLFFIRFVWTQLRNLDLRNHVLNTVLAREGDINIGQLADITVYDPVSNRCGPTRALFGCEAIQMGLYAVDEINRRTDLLPNITLGLVMMDTCSKDMRALEVITYFGKRKACNGTNNDTKPPSDLLSRNSSFAEVLRHYDVVGIVGPRTSAVSTAVASLMGVFEIPMIATLATSDDLSDKIRYEYFVRVVAPDRYLARALLGIVQHFGWYYLSVVYNSGSYGENAFAQIKDSIKGVPASDICIAASLMISTNPVDSEFDAIADSLIAYSHARIVVVFVEDINKAQRVFSAVRKKRRIGSFVWIGADAMSSYEYEPTMGNMLEGALFVTHPSYVMPDFSNYLTTVTPAKSQGNTWMLKLWEHRYRCSFGANQSSVPPCSMNLTLDSSLCPADPSQHDRLHDAYMVYAHALHGLIRDNCPEAFQRKEILNDCIQGKKLLERLQTSSFNGVLGEIKFDENGDFLENLVIKQFYRPSTNSSVAVTKPVGWWNTTDMTMHFNDSLLSWAMFYENTSGSDNYSRPPESICSRPCLPHQFMIKESVRVCCWSCVYCRDNEIVVDDRSGCDACPVFTWPDENNDTVCSPIAPDYLHVSHFISVALIFLTILAFLMMVVCVYVFVARRQTKLMLEVGIHMKLTALAGVFVACIVIVTLLVYPGNTTYICGVRIIGFHFGTTMIFAPQLIKVVRVYRKHLSRRVRAQEPTCISVQSQMMCVSSVFAMQFILLVVSEVSSPSVASLRMPNLFANYVEIYCYQKTALFLVPVCYNVCIMLLCACVAFFCRKLPMEFNDSSFTFISVSITLFSWVVFIPAYFSVPQMHLQPAVLGFALTLNSITTMLVQYFPVVYSLEFAPDSRPQAVSTPRSEAKSSAQSST